MVSEQEALAQQKENCIFCKIIKGDVPAKKVYEDEKLIAILDINPAKKGHVLVMPKEHYPILPLVPFDDMQHIFQKTKKIIDAIKEAMLCQGVSVFIANGGAAGQQSPHFLFHLIPRDQQDMFSALDLPVNGSKEENDAAIAAIKQKFQSYMQAYLAQTGRQDKALQQNPAQVPVPPITPEPEEKPKEPAPAVETDQQQMVAAPGEPVQEEQLDELIAVINANDDLKEALINRPEEVKEAVQKYEKWRRLFAGVDIDKLSENLRVMATANVKKKETKDDLDKVGELL